MTSQTRKSTQPWRDRAPKENPNARCCWVCGKLGGQGFTLALRIAGYRMQPREMGYAHNKCMRRAALEGDRTAQATASPSPETDSSHTEITDAPCRHDVVTSLSDDGSCLKCEADEGEACR